MDVKYLNIIKRKKKYISLQIGTPPRKRDKTKNKSEIQKQVIESMRAHRKKKLKMDLAVQIITYSTDRDTPSIAEWVKNIVDLMHKKEYLENANDAEFLPFEDDSKIKYLYARYFFVGDSPSIHIKIHPFSGFISDLHLLNEYRNKNAWNDYRDGKNWKNQDWLRLKELETNRQKYIELFSKEAYENMVMMAQEDQQKYLSEALAISRHLITTIYPKDDQYQKYFKNIYRDWSNMLLKAPLRLSLPGIPKDGSTKKEIAKQYKQMIQRKLEEYKKSISVLGKIINPMVVTIMYRPARGRDKKDIDNILLEYILPKVNTVFSPPASSYGLTEYSIDSVVRKVPLAKDMKGQPIGYEILKLPFDIDSPDGELFFGFNFDYNDDTLMNQTEKFLDEYLPHGHYF